MPADSSPYARWLRAAAGPAVGLILLALAARGAPLSEVTAAVADAHWPWLIAAVALDGVVFTIKALKWRWLMAPVCPVPVSTALAGVAVGSLAGLALPLRLDEAVRAVWLGTRLGIARTTVLGTIILERLVDAAGLAAGTSALLLFLGGSSWLPGRRSTLAAAALAVVIALGSVAATPHLLRRLHVRPPAVLAGPWEKLEAGLSATSPVRLGAAFLLVMAEWSLAMFYMAAVLRAFDLDLSATAALALVVASYLSFALPAAPAGMGQFEFAVKGALTAAFAVPPAKALACALTLHVLLVAPVALAGAAVLASRGRRT